MGRRGTICFQFTLTSSPAPAPFRMLSYPSSLSFPQRGLWVRMVLRDASVCLRGVHPALPYGGPFVGLSPPRLPVPRRCRRPHSPCAPGHGAQQSGCSLSPAGAQPPMASALGTKDDPPEDSQPPHPPPHGSKGSSSLTSSRSGSAGLR